MKQKFKTVFLVEDDPDISELIKIVVQNEGFRIKTFSEMKDVEVAAAQYLPNLILMDLFVGGFDGAKMVRKLKKKKETANIPVVLVSAKNSLAEIAMECSADGFLPKPFNIKNLTDILHTFV